MTAAAAAPPALFIDKYKPKNLDDFFLTDAVKDTLQLLREMDDMNVLFVGNANAGKTSLLLVLVNEYYNTPTPPPYNIMHINNLKEQGVQFFRTEMLSFCKSQSSVHGKKKIIIIDDIDMINQQNQQVFCNYIDKFRNNVCFLLAGSNKQKIIENIQSRVHIIGIDPPSPMQLRGFLCKIMCQEQLMISTEAQDYLLSISGQSVRCVIKHLEKLKYHEGPVDLALCKQICSSITLQWFEEYFALVKTAAPGGLQAAIDILYNISDYGYSVIDIFYYLFQFIETAEMLTEREKYKITMLLCEYITMFHNVHEDTIELALFTNKLYKTFLDGEEIPV
jgi:DNA polymerase III delta prime subunit